MVADDMILHFADRCPKREDGGYHCRHRVSETRTFGVLTESVERCCHCGDSVTVKHEPPKLGSHTYTAPKHGPFAPETVLVYSRG